MLSAMVSLLKAAGLLRDPSAIGVTSPVACRQIEAAMLKLGKQLRSASSLPLKIVAVQPLSAAARHTAAFPPLPHPFAGGQRADSSAKVDRCLDTIDLLAQLEGSGVAAMSASSPPCSI